MRIEYDENGSLCMYPDNENEFGIMNMFCKEIFGYVIRTSYVYSREYGFILTFLNEPKLRSIIEKMKDDKVERILQIRHENKWIRLAARVMLELWG